MYLPMELDNDTHFFNLPINTTHSSVHVPTNIYHRHDEAETAIRWSKELDEVFIQNYRADPALSWQYFGSSSGIMRHYPAMNWNNSDKGLFDCRIRTWFIEAATCTKDVVILLDNSGSMQGWSRHISFLIVDTILETLSNNDYINVMNYSESVEYLIPCFEGKLVQATEENIQVIKDALPQMVPTNKSNVEIALRSAFDLLTAYREVRNCNEKHHLCNQAIMLISDGIPSNLSYIVEECNRLENGSIPIRIFTYLVGKEPAHLEESMWIACTNRGYHCHVDALEQVTQAVYKYVMVLARPLVLQEKSHPLSWTHAYADTTFSKEQEGFESYRLLTSIAGPAFNTKEHLANKRRGKILGVAGTDVPITEIAKLMFPYKTGACSHSFIVSNNGYVLKHPGLAPLADGELTVNYNSVDLTEVEQLDDDSGPRMIGDDLLNLRTAMVKGEYGVLHDLKIKFHYDDMRRVSREVNDYFFAPINNTPFSIGFAIPDLYGNYSIEVKQTIELYKHNTINISSFFEGNDWKIHPKWVYCRYHYLEGHEYDSPESELRDFLSKVTNDDFKWAMQYEHDDHKNSSECGAKTLDDDAYYCDKTLLEHLIFDANLTRVAYGEPWTSRSEIELNRQSKYNATLRFIATMSGLTRWEYIGDLKPTSPMFGDLYPRAVDEVWYRSAVIEHRHNNDSFVYTVPLETRYHDSVTVTGSHAIFLTVDIKEAPGAVVGYQFSHAKLYEQFFNIVTSSPRCPDCFLCGPDLECYVIDHSGYVVISREKEYTGTFFGIYEGVTMQTLVELGIYEKLTVRNYQAMCLYPQWEKGDCSTLMTPFVYVSWFFNWILSQIAWFIVQLHVPRFWDINWILINADEEFTTTSSIKPTVKRCLKNCKEEEEKWHEQNKIPVYQKKRTACDREHDVYVFNPTPFKNNEVPKEEITLEDCKRPFYVKQIPWSNLLLVAIKTTVEETCYYLHTTKARDIVYDNYTTFPCQKLYLNDLSRTPLQGCFNEHPLEGTIEDCGKGGRLQFYRFLMYLSAFILTFHQCFY